MLKKKFRGLKRGDFLRSKNEGILLQTPLFGVSVMKNEEGFKCGIMVTKRVEKLAVKRNKWRRLILKSCQENWENLKMKPLTVIFLVRRSVDGKKYDEVAEVVRRLGKEIDEKFGN